MIENESQARRKIAGLVALPVDTPGRAPGARWRSVLKRVVEVSFLFFLIKGMAWLVIGWLAWKGID